MSRPHPCIQSALAILPGTALARSYESSRYYQNVVTTTVGAAEQEGDSVWGGSPRSRGFLVVPEVDLVLRIPNLTLNTFPIGSRSTSGASGKCAISLLRRVEPFTVTLHHPWFRCAPVSMSYGGVRRIRLILVLARQPRPRGAIPNRLLDLVRDRNGSVATSCRNLRPNIPRQIPSKPLPSDSARTS
jgi:hypothetical protein